MIFINELINNITELYNLTDENSLSKLKDYDIPHINLYGSEGSMKKFYAYFIINNLNNININTKEFNIQEQNILIKNNNVSFKLINHQYFKQINLYHKLGNERHILKNYILSIIDSKNIFSKKHIFIIDDFDKLKYNSYMLLRRCMELYNKHVIFIFISNNLSRIPDAIKSRCLNIRCPILDSKKIVKIVQRLTKNYDIEKKEITKLVKNNELDIYKILLNLENLVNREIDYTSIDKHNNYKDILNDEIIKHLNVIKKEKNPFKVLQKNREFIFKIINFNFNNQIIIDNFVKIIIKKYHKYLSIHKIIELSSKTEHAILQSSREFYHYELYLLRIYKMFHSDLLTDDIHKLESISIN
jgi:DNA polymerase III delta prime subunit